MVSSILTLCHPIKMDEQFKNLALKKLSDPVWRITSGKIYKVKAKAKGKTDDGESGSIIQDFIPNYAQRIFLRNMHQRNIILKCRQLGFTTLVCLLWIDTALFSEDPIDVVIIAHDEESMESILRTKVRFVYENLPGYLKEKFWLLKDNTTEMIFGHNNSRISVALSSRSSTPSRLLVSEFGKISARYPRRAIEVSTGAFPSVPKEGLIIVESTAEGAGDNRFYKMVKSAMALRDAGAKLSIKDYKLHFFPWWQAPEYRINPDGIIIPSGLVSYFDRIERHTRTRIDESQRAWYFRTLDTELQGDLQLMWREYPSTEEEAFEQSTEGCWYSDQLAAAEEQGRLVNYIPTMPEACHTFWDIGKGDMTAIWVMQRIGVEYRFIRYYENTGEDLDHYTDWLQKQGLTYAVHWLPHEAVAKPIGIKTAPHTTKSKMEMLEMLLLGHQFEPVQRIDRVVNGIQQTRQAFRSVWICRQGCHQGIQRLRSYRKKFDAINSRFTDEPVHNDDCHGADAFRGFGQLLAAGEQFISASSQRIENRQIMREKINRKRRSLI